MAEQLTILENYLAYFKALAAKHKEIKHFEHGPSERIIASTRSKTTYPMFWLETPGFQFGDNGGNVTGTPMGAFIIAMQASPAKPEEQDAAWCKTQKWTLAFLARMKKDARVMGFRIDFNKVVTEAISPLWVDNLHGWRTEFTILDTLDVCHDFSQWND